MERTMFVVADRSRAHLYMVGGSRLAPTLERIDTLDDPEGRGSSADSSGMHASFVDTDGNEDEHARRFARSVVKRLESGLRGGEFRRVLLAAPASMVGHLRGCYGTKLRTVIEREIVGDYVQQSVRELEARVLRRAVVD